MRKNIGRKSLLYPEPVLIVSAYDENGKANAMTAAWGGISDTNEIMICLSEDHKTTKNILLKKEFTVAPGTKEKVVECDYLGMTSGNKDADKIDKCGFEIVKSEVVDAPLILDFPFILECRLISYDENTGHLFGSIVDINVDENILTDGRVDLNKYHPVVFDGSNNTYVCLGEKAGNAFKDYLKLI